LGLWGFVGILAGATFTSEWPSSVMIWAGTAFLTLQIVGHVLCLTVPRGWRVRGSEALALSLAVLYLGLYLGAWVGQGALIWAVLGRWEPWGVVGFWALRALAPAARLVFVANFARWINQEELAQRSQALIPFLFILLVLPFVTYAALQFFGNVFFL